MKLIRAAIYIPWFYLSLAVIGIGGLPLALSSHKGVIRVMQAWGRAQRAMLALLGVRTELRGLAHLPPGPCLIAMKHQGTYDIVLPLLFLKDPAFVLKRELLGAPVLGYYSKRSGQIPIDRDGGAKTLKRMLEAARAAAQAGRTIVIFPEGTRQKIGAPVDYKPGVAGLYRTLGLPCVPVALNTGLIWPGSMYAGARGTALVEMLEPIPPGLSREDFMAALEAALEPATARLVAEGRAAAQNRPPADDSSMKSD